MQLKEGLDVDQILAYIAKKYSNEKISTIDGVKIDFKDKWAHLRKSNTEPIIRIYAEAATQEDADQLSNEIIKNINTK